MSTTQDSKHFLPRSCSCLYPTPSPAWQTIDSVWRKRLTDAAFRSFCSIFVPRVIGAFFTPPLMKQAKQKCCYTSFHWCCACKCVRSNLLLSFSWCCHSLHGVILLMLPFSWCCPLICDTIILPILIQSRRNCAILWCGLILSFVMELYYPVL